MKKHYITLVGMLLAACLSQAQSLIQTGGDKEVKLTTRREAAQGIVTDKQQPSVLFVVTAESDMSEDFLTKRKKFLTETYIPTVDGDRKKRAERELAIIEEKLK